MNADAEKKIVDLLGLPYPPMVRLLREAMQWAYADAAKMCRETEMTFDHGTCKSSGADACIVAIEQRAKE